MSCDPNFADVGLLLHCDGTNGSTTFIDSSSFANIMTAIGVAAIDTSAPEFGSGAMNLGTGTDSAVTCPITGGGPLDLTTGDFTLEGWFKTAAVISSSFYLIEDLGGWTVFVAAAGGGTCTVECSFTTTGGSISASNASAFTPTIGTWYSWAVIRSGSTLTVYLNGVAGTPVSIHTGSATSSGTLTIGANASFAPVNNGEQDEIRVTKGLARYSSNYTPAGPFGGSCATTVPNVNGELLATGEAAIVSAGLVVGSVTQTSDPIINAGYIISTSPAGGSSAMIGDTVNITESNSVTVPDVALQPLAAGESTLTGLGFTVGIVTSVFSLTVPGGYIISTSPIAGVRATLGDTVDIVESDGPGTGTVPNVINLSATLAEAAIVAAGFVVGTVSEQPDAIIIAGNVDVQNPVGGTIAFLLSPVDITVSTGLPSLLVPDLFGLTQTDAITLLLSLGLSVGAIGSAPSKFLPPGEVQAQNPSAGTPVAAGSIVSFVLSLGTPAVGTLFDFEATVISQYANSPTILQLVQNLNYYVDQSANFANFFNYVWNVDTAVGFGLDIWGKIVGVRRLLQIPNTTDYVGFDNSATPPPDWQTMGSTQTVGGPVGGAMYTGDNATTAYLLPDDSYRQLILAKAFANICTTTAPAINQILQNLYGVGTAWVLNTGVMAISYNLTFTPTAIQLAILEQSGVIPTPPGVSVVINTGV